MLLSLSERVSHELLKTYRALDLLIVRADPVNKEARGKHGVPWLGAETFDRPSHRSLELSSCRHPPVVLPRPEPLKSGSAGALSTKLVWATRSHIVMASWET